MPPERPGQRGHEGAVNVNQYFNGVRDVLAYSRAHQLAAIPGWHFLTGPAAALQAVWHGYNVEVQAPDPDADIVHTSVVYFIGPASQLSAWGRGIALVARTLMS